MISFDDSFDLSKKKKHKHFCLNEKKKNDQRICFSKKKIFVESLDLFKPFI